MAKSKIIDVRPVEPKYRFETIMSEWRSLAQGDSFYLKVDHDPTCMYYTLAADYGEESFTFDYLHKGPEIWEVRVGKR